MRSHLENVAARLLAISCVLLLSACSADSGQEPSRGSSVVTLSEGTGVFGSAGSSVTGGAGRSSAPVNTGAPGLGAMTQPGFAGSPAPVAPAPGLAGAAAPAAPTPAPGIGGQPAAPPPTAAPTPANPMAMMPPMMVAPNQSLPAITNYGAVGPYPAGQVSTTTGPDGDYTLIRPTNLNANGFKFIPATWGNGITTTPQTYPWLATVASHGFVIIAANTTTVTPELMTKGLDWLIQQNDMPGELQGKLDTSRAVCIGYSLGGGGAVSCGSHPKVIATVAMHPAPGFGTGLHGPLLLFSGTNDTVCVPETFVQPIYDGSKVPTFFGMLDGADHLEPVLGGRETAPFIAWLRLWVFGDQGAKSYFYGTDCKLCNAPWIKPQSKMLN